MTKPTFEELENIILPEFTFHKEMHSDSKSNYRVYKHILGLELIYIPIISEIELMIPLPKRDHNFSGESNYELIEKLEDRLTKTFEIKNIRLNFNYNPTRIAIRFDTSSLQPLKRFVNDLATYVVYIQNFYRQKTTKPRPVPHACGYLAPGYQKANFIVYHGTGVGNKYMHVMKTRDLEKDLKLTDFKDYSVIKNKVFPHLRQAPLNKHEEYDFYSISTTCDKKVAEEFAGEGYAFGLIITYQLQTDKLYVMSPEELNDDQFFRKIPNFKEKTEAVMIPTGEFKEHEIAVLNPEILTPISVEYYFDGQKQVEKINPQNLDTTLINLGYKAIIQENKLKDFQQVLGQLPKTFEVHDLFLPDIEVKREEGKIKLKYTFKKGLYLPPTKGIQFDLKNLKKRFKNTIEKEIPEIISVKIDSNNLEVNLPGDLPLEEFETIIQKIEKIKKSYKNFIEYHGEKVSTQLIKIARKIFQKKN